MRSTVDSGRSTIARNPTKVESRKSKVEPLVSILIVTYNRWDLLEHCLAAIAEQSYQNLEVIVVDNGSDDATRQGLHQLRHVTTIRPRRNLGFAGGNNLAARYAKGEYLFLLNNDAFLGRNTLADLLGYMEKHPDVTIAQPTIVVAKQDTDDRLLTTDYSNGTGSFLTQWGFLWHRGLRQPLRELPTKPDRIFSALGAGLLVRRDAVKRHGLFDDSFFAYFEETDLCWRLWTRGGSVVYVPTDPMTHLGGQTAKTFNERLAIFVAYRNRLVSFWRHLEFWHLMQILILHHVAILGVAFVVLSRRPKASGWILAVVLWELTHPLTLLKTRAQHMKRRTVHDRELWPAIFRPVSLRQMLQYLRN